MAKAQKSKFQLINKYQIDYATLIGSSQRAKVFLGYYSPEIADESNKNVKFAIKQTEANSSHAVEILQEIHLLRKLTHPYIVKYIDAYQVKTSFSLVLQYCEGGTLQGLLKEYKGKVPEDILKRLIAQIVIALKFLKDQNIIHRDIKPKNILLHNGNIKIADFGVAKFINHHNGDREIIGFSGTQAYMSPQILQQQRYTYQTDVWSLAVTIFQMVYGKLPWKTTKGLKILEEIANSDNYLPDPDEEPIDLQLYFLLLGMFAKEDNDRITIEQIRKHPYLAEEIKKLEKQLGQNQIMVEGQQVTPEQFIQLSEDISMKFNSDLLDRRAKYIRSSLGNSNIQQDPARSAYRKLSNYNEHIEFFREILQKLKKYHRKPRIIEENLFLLCEFLLVKRIYIIAESLHKILSVNKPSQGNITIPEEEFNQLIEGKNIYYGPFRDRIGRIFQEITAMWHETKERFFDSRRKRKLDYIPRGDAYSDQNIVQNTNLILAFNDNFTKLFLKLAEGIVQEYAKDAYSKIDKAQILSHFGVQIKFIYDLIVLLTFPRIQENYNHSNYRAKIKKTACEQLIYRISVVYKLWKPQQPK